MDLRLLDINRHGVLNPPVSYWWATAFLLRHWLLLLVVGVSAISGAAADWAYGALGWQALVAEAPMLLSAYAWAQRSPQAGALPRMIWARGREIMSITALLSVAWAGWYLAGQSLWRPWPERMIAALALIDAVILVGCWRSAVYRQLFAEFPSPPETPLPTDHLDRQRR